MRANLRSKHQRSKVTRNKNVREDSFLRISLSKVDQFTETETKMIDGHYRNILPAETRHFTICLLYKFFLLLTDLELEHDRKFIFYGEVSDSSPYTSKQ